MFRARIARERSSVVTGLAPEGAPTYSRNQYGDFSERLGSAVAGVYAFEAGDKIEIQGLFEGQGSTVQLDLVGARSGISIVAVGAGPQGEQGIPGTGAVTNLAIASRDADSLDITSDTGTDATIPSASTTEAGLASAADKTKLDGVATGATAVSSQAIQAIVNATNLSALQGQLTDGQIPAAIMRDAEFTAAAIRTLLSLTDTEVNDLLTGASIVGQILTFTQNDGTTVAITIPTAMAGTGDGVVQSGAIVGTNLVLTLDTGGEVTIDIETLATDLELVTLSDATPQALATAGEAGDSEDASRSDHVHPDFLYQGDWSSSNAPYAAAQIVLNNSINWLSLSNNNSEIPAPASLLWAGLPQGYLYRGTAPTFSTKYHYGHTVFVPPSQAYYICTSTAGLSGVDATRAEIPGHAQFKAISPLLSDASPTDVGAAAAGIGIASSRDDHVHGGGDGTVLNGNGAPAGNSGNDGDTYRDDQSGAWYKKASGAWSAVLYTPAPGVALSDEYPVNIGPQSQQGVGDEAARDDHTHYLPHDSTVGFVDGALAVSIHDVVEHLSERVRYYTDAIVYNTDGSAAGQVYNTSRYPKNLQWVKAILRVPTGVSDAIYRAGVYRVNETRVIQEVLGESGASGIITGTGEHRFDFIATDTSSFGIPLEGSERIMILIRRVGAGNTAATGLIRGEENVDSPSNSYPDAVVDFILTNNVQIEHENPTVGQGTHSHGEEIRGNLQLGYTVTINHGALVGDQRNVNAAHIDSGAATDDEFLGNDGNGAAEWKVPPGGASLSDDDPVNVSISLPEEGTAADASRRDHRHRVDQSNANQYGVTRYATDAEALAATSISRTISPANLGHVLGEFLSDDDPEDVGTAGEGTGIEASRSDHVHGGGTGGGGPDATGATDGHVWTADGADGAEWEAAPGAGGGTTVVANPTGTDGDDLTRVSIAGTNYVIPAGGGSTGTEPDLFVSPIGLLSSVGIPSSPQNELSLSDANVRINRGGYAIVAGTNSQQAIEIPADGTYTIAGTMRAEFSTTALGRNYVEWSVVVIRATVIIRTVPASVYTRSNLLFDVYTNFTYTDDFVDGDLIELRAKEVSVDAGTYHVGGGNSYISIIREAVGGASGAEGQQAGDGTYERQEITPSPNPYPLTISGNYNTGFVTVWNPFDIVDIPKDDFESMTLIVDVNGRFDLTFQLDKFDLIENIGFTDEMNFSQWDNADTNRIPAMHWSGGFSATGTKFPIISRPSYGHVNGLRSAGAPQCLIVFRESTIGGVEHFQAINFIVFGTTNMSFRGGSIVKRI